MDSALDSTSATPARPRPPHAGAQREPPAAVVRQVPAVSRAIAILRLLGQSDAPLGVHAVASELRLVPSTCLHILRVLVAEELASFDPATKRYALAGGILAIARGLLRAESFSDLAAPVLQDISRRFGVTAVGVEAVGLRHMVVEAIARADGIQLHVDLGSRFPALISATGRCVAAFGGHKLPDVERGFRALRWARPPNWTDWQREVETTRTAGYAVDEGRYIDGITIVAAPVMTGRGATHGLVIVGMSESLRRLGHETLGSELRNLAATLSEKLRARPGP